VGALLLAAVAGLTFPDLDQSLPFFDHRSALTHSVLAALILAARRWLVAVAAGLALGLALHLAADCFPEAMRGYATIKVPFAGSLGGWSYLWLGANAAAGAWLFGRLLDDGVPDVRLRIMTLGAALLLGIWYLVQVDGGYFALATGAGLGWASWRLRGRDHGAQD
jgi:predicted MFS family arabinose efflux permease